MHDREPAKAIQGQGNPGNPGKSSFLDFDALFLSRLLFRPLNDVDSMDVTGR